MKRQLQDSGLQSQPLNISQDSLLTCMSCKVEWYCVFHAEIKLGICFQSRNLEFRKSRTGGSLKANRSSGSFFGQCHGLFVGDVKDILLPLTDTAFLLNASFFSKDISSKHFFLLSPPHFWLSFVAESLFSVLSIEHHHLHTTAVVLSVLYCSLLLSKSL